MQNDLQRVCAWCKKSIGADLKTSQQGITHGICPTCSAKMIEEEDALSMKPSNSNRMNRLTGARKGASCYGSGGKNGHNA